MSAFVEESQLRYELEGLGDIIRIDFTAVDKKPGFVEKMTGNVKSAFVHFGFIHLEHKANVELVRALNNGDSAKFYPITMNGTWVFLKNKYPIPNTFMNNSQIVENSRFLEEKVKMLEDKLAKLEARMDYPKWVLDLA